MTESTQYSAFKILLIRSISLCSFRSMTASALNQVISIPETIHVQNQIYRYTNLIPNTFRAKVPKIGVQRGIICVCRDLGLPKLFSPNSKTVYLFKFGKTQSEPSLILIWKPIGKCGKISDVVLFQPNLKTDLGHWFQVFGLRKRGHNFFLKQQIFEKFHRCHIGQNFAHQPEISNSNSCSSKIEISLFGIIS